jgi:hypothetical protein
MANSPHCAPSLEVTRRDALKALGATAAMVGLGSALAPSLMAQPAPVSGYTLGKLAYAYESRMRTMR